jgi:hypothetical protein
LPVVFLPTATCTRFTALWLARHDKQSMIELNNNVSQMHAAPGLV